ncbi:DUF6114 domain-containing protein [Catenulispora pinisilvae]|uniref:DUF6114 domain-containing protein n=1 Tax=Catenulispora pinisilvae TaxID=2705253 RepID=UPI00189101EF|nr:DUF6114 domain-containing protein [Catenulispora pinisilvae]
MTEHEEGAPLVFPEAPAPEERRGVRRAFRHWRRTRPFWGGLLVTLGGGEILALYRASLKDTMHMGLYGLGGYLVPVLLVILGLSLIFDPPHRTFYSVLSLLFAVASWMTSNLGGFIIGMLLAMTGASLAFGWAESQQPEEESAPVQEKEPEGLPTA